MKTVTMQLPDEVYDRAERFASERGVRLPDEIAEFLRQYSESVDNQTAPAKQRPGTSVVGGISGIAQRFHDLVKEWKEATLVLSSTTEMVTHPAYQQIIGMGSEAIPLLVDELRREPDHWFWALKSITGEDPVPAADRGKLQRMTEAWLDWARNRGY